MADTGQTAHAGQSISVKVEGSNIQITLHGQVHGQSRAVGWGAVEDAVQKDDERQVQSCKEDIDSLLTFAGLYSAALTALLALSFAMLQEDTAGESLQVLRQIALQTATYQLLPGGGLNSTAAIPPPSSSPFEPSRAALRVNILWFASLVFSLSTASIGILVKQWLRAYTSYRTSSAQGRMRVRYFRHQGMEIWKVYEIAAVLPFIIQLALGLFFVGLCYFTAGVHADLGHATLPLVAGWALFIFVVTILPIFSSHCPYKPALSEHLFSAIRPALFLCVERTLATIDRTTVYFYKLTPALFHFLALVWTMVDLIVRAVATSIGEVLEVCKHRLVTSLITPARLAEESLFEKAQEEQQKVKELEDLQGRFIGRLALWARKHTRASSDRPYDEADAVKYAGKDLDILMFADALQSDDELLGTAVADALKQTQPTLEHIAEFAVGVLRSRDLTELNAGDEPPSRWFDCRSLTPRAATAIADVVAQHHNLIRHDAAPRTCCWLYRTLLSLPRPLPTGGLFLDMLTLYGEDDDVWGFQIQRILKSSSQPPDQSLHLILGAFKLFWVSKYLPSHSEAPRSEILDNASSCVSKLLDATLDYAGLSDANLSEDPCDGSLERRMIFNDFPLQDTIEWLTRLVRQEVESKQDNVDAMSVRETLELIFDLYRLDFISCSSQRGTLSGRSHASLMQDCSRYCIENSIKGLRWAIRCYAQSPSRVIWMDNLTLRLHVYFADEDALQHLYHAVTNFDINDVLTSNKSSACGRICYVVVHILRDVSHEDMTVPVVRLWRRILRHVTLMLPDPGECHQLPKDTEQLVRLCLHIIDWTDRGPQYLRCSGDDEIKKQEWRIQFKPEDSPFSDHFVLLLSRLLSEETRADELCYRWRLPMVEEKYKEDKDAVLKDDEHDDDEGASEQKDGEGAAPELIEPPTVIANSADANKSDAANNAMYLPAADSSLSHAGGCDAGDSDQAHGEGSVLKPADGEESDDTEAAGEFMRDMTSNRGEEQPVAGNLGDTHDTKLASAASDHPGTDLQLDSV